MHFHSTLSILALVLSFANPILASQYYNCIGTFADCRNLRFISGDDIAQKLTGYINGIDPVRHYKYGEYIAWEAFDLRLLFKGNICAFVRNAGGASGSSIRNVAHYILDKNCKARGMVPLDYRSISGGLLVYDSMKRGACINGLCLKKRVESGKEEKD